MSLIYGQSGAEKDLIQNCPSEINCFEDIKSQLAKYKKNLESSRKTFFEKLPDLIKKEKVRLLTLETERQDVEVYWNEKLNIIRKSIKSNKLKIWKYFDLFIKEHFSKSKAIRIAVTNIDHKKLIINRLEYKPEDVFQGKQTLSINTIHQLEQNIKSPEYSGAYGEIRVFNELKKLKNSYHVLCDVNVCLKDYVRYHGTRNLRSAQMDFVVVGPTGIFVIEVKNWSSDHINHHTGISPHEQVDRAGFVLWVYLKQHSYFFKPRVTNVLVPIQHNLRYNQYYKSVSIRNVSGLKQFIYNNSNALTESKINKVVSLLK